MLQTLNPPAKPQKLEPADRKDRQVAVRNNWSIHEQMQRKQEAELRQLQLLQLIGRPLVTSR